MTVMPCHIAMVSAVTKQTLDMVSQVDTCASRGYGRFNYAFRTDKSKAYDVTNFLLYPPNTNFIKNGRQYEKSGRKENRIF